MSDGQSFSWGALLFGLFTLIAVGAFSFVFAFTSIPLWLIGMLPVALTALILIWHHVALGRYRSQGAAILARSPVVLLVITGVMLVIGVLLTLFVNDRVTSLGWIVLATFLGGLFYIAYLPSTLLFYVADAEGVTRQILSFSKTLPWKAIDWVYARENRVTQSAQVAVVEIPVLKWTEKTIIVEAGAKLGLTILTSAPLVGGNATSLIEAIRSSATNALIGFEQLPAVHARRANGTTSANLPAFVDIPTAIGQARRGVLTQGCMIFSAIARTIWFNLLLMSGIGLGLIAAGFYTALAGSSILLQIIPQNLVPEGLLPFIPFIELVLWEIFGLVCLTIGLRWIVALRNTNAYFLLVTPEGFAVVKGRKIEGARFADTRDIELTTGLYGQQVKTTMRDGKTQEIEVNIFGRARDILAYLLAARKGGAPQHAGSLGMPFRTENEG